MSKQTKRKTQETNAAFAQAFGTYVCDGDAITVSMGGFDVTAKIEADEDSGAPWKRDDGHGPVSDWTGREKRPGERVLSEDRTSKRYYDFEEAVKIAKRDGWGWLPGPLKIDRDKPSKADGSVCGGRVTCGEFTAYDPKNFNRAIGEVYAAHRASMTADQYAAGAADRDFEVLKAWCKDEWCYVGVVLSVAKNDIVVCEHAASLWGIEANYPGSDNSYLTEVANDLLSEALEAAAQATKDMIAKLSAKPQRRAARGLGL
jgi:hypothetical protein